MVYNRSTIFVLTIMLCLATAPAFAEEELFDTAAASIHMEQGISYLMAKDYDAAINEFDESASIAPEAEAYYYLGYAYYMKGKKAGGESRKSALENFEKAYDIDRNFTPTRYEIPEPAPEMATAPSATEVPASPEPELEPEAMQPAEPDAPAQEQPQPEPEPEAMQPAEPESPESEQEQPAPEDWL
jgi:tetratricopeptide (TPR) repeat protein